ncbi:MAG: ATP-binding protein, partial [Hyphomicrobiales bacterium]
DIRVNPAFAAMLGIAPTTNASKHGQAGARLPFRITRAGSEVPSPELPMQRAARTGETLVNEEFTVEFPAGRPPLRLLEFAAPLLDEDGQPRGAVGAFVDITERRRTEEAERFLADVGRALSESLDYDATIQRLARVSCEALADYCLVDVLASDGAIQRKAAAGATRELDELAQGLLPYPPDTSGRNPIVSVMVTGVPRVGPAPPQQVEDRVAQDETHRRIIRAIGARTWLCVPLIAHGTTIGALTFGSRSENRYGDFELAVAQQVADRAAIAISNATLYQESKRAADDLRRASAVKDEFLGMMSHELRTPLTGILGNAQILRRHGDRIPASFRDSAIADIEHEADRLKRLVENMLVLAQVEAEHDIIPEPVLLQRLALDVVEEHRRRHPWRHVNCVVDSGLLPVRAAPVYVEQVLRNLISNAEKYSENDEKIEVQVLSMGDSVGAIVLDRGVGVPGEELEMLFRPFFRSDSTAHTASGAGLGLAVCKRLIEVQSGRIWAAPRQDGGMEFGFSLPVQKE